jgi:hypothetical protein
MYSPLHEWRSRCDRKVIHLENNVTSIQEATRYVQFDPEADVVNSSDEVEPSINRRCSVIV